MGLGLRQAVDLLTSGNRSGAGPLQAQGPGPDPAAPQVGAGGPRLGVGGLVGHGGAHGGLQEAGLGGGQALAVDGGAGVGEGAGAAVAQLVEAWGPRREETS